MELLKPVEDIYKVFWNNRIDRFPEAYPSFSQMINDSVVTSPTEIVIWVNDRITPKPEDIIHIVQMLHSGFAAASRYSSAFMGTTKELYRQIGWWDERFFGGGWEDDDFVLRLRLANLAYYESQTAEYLEARILNMPHKITPLMPDDDSKSSGGPQTSKIYFDKKWAQTEKAITKTLSEQEYPEYSKAAGPSIKEIKESWKGWDNSMLGVDCRYPLAGESRTKWFCYLRRDNGAPIKENGEWVQYRSVLRDCDG